MNVFNGVLIAQDVRSISLMIVMIGLRCEDNSKGAALFFGVRPIQHYYLLCLVTLCNAHRLSLSAGGRRLLNR